MFITRLLAYVLCTVCCFAICLCLFLSLYLRFRQTPKLCMTQGDCSSKLTHTTLNLSVFIEFTVLLQTMSQIVKWVK